MALDNLKGKPVAEQLAIAAEFVGVSASVLDGLWRTESARGQNMRSRAGARGHFQLMPATQATWEQRTGRKFNPDDFSDALTMAALTLKENLAATKGNVPDALRMYNAGPDRKRWGNEETQAYVGKVLGDKEGIYDATKYEVNQVMQGNFDVPDPEMIWNTSAHDLMQLDNARTSGSVPTEILSAVEKGLVAQAGVEAAVNVELSDSLTDPAAAAITARADVRDNKELVTDSVLTQLGTLPIGTGTEPAQAWDSILDVQAAQEEDEADTATIGDKLVATMTQNNLTVQAIVKMMDDDNYVGEADPNFDYMQNIDEIEKDRDQDEIDELRSSGAVRWGEIHGIRQRQDEEREAFGVLADGSSTSGVIGWSLLGGVTDPLGWLAGMGVGKAAQIVGVGSRAAFNAGRVGRALIFAGGEGAAGNVLTTAALDAMGTHQSTNDYAMSAGFGLLIGGAFGSLDYRGNAKVIAEDEMSALGNKLQQDAAEYNAKLYEKAVAEAGPNAGSEQIVAAAKRIEADEYIKFMDTIFADVPDERRIFPRPDADEAPPMPEARTIPDEFIAKTKAGEFRLTDTLSYRPENASEFGVPRIVEAFDGDTKVGELLYANDGTPPTVTVEPSHQRKGIATAMLKLAKQRGGVLGDAETGVAGNARPGYRTDEGQAFRTNANEDAVELTSRTELTGKMQKQDSLPGSILNTRKKRKAAYKKYGLDVSISDDAERKLVAEMFARAERILGADAVDPARLRPLLAKAGWEATSTRMLLSNNPVMRATAAILLENPEGAAGRNVTAAMTKSMRERVYLGNTLREYDNAYAVWRGKEGGSGIKDAFDDSLRRRFDKEVYAERDRRFNGKEGGTDDQAVLTAADVLDNGYNRMRKEQQYVGTIGAQRLGQVDVRGYTPRRMAPGIVAGLNDAQRRAFTSALSGEFQATAGFDKDFSDKFAIKYLERAVQRAKGAYDVPGNLHSDDAADIVRDSLRALSMNEEQIAAVLGRFSRGGAQHTKSRIDADLTTVYPDGTPGGSLRLMDLMNTDNLSLFRAYARRVSGEVSLAKYGIMGEQGLKELRKAMEVGPDGMRATPKEMESFDQVAAEFLGRPFGTHLGKIADNARSFTSALRLGGMGFNQFGEYANGVASVGVLRSLKAIASLPRLLGEVRAMKAGRAVKNDLLNSMELYGGEFGMDGYKMRAMYDVNDGYEVYGQEALGVVSKAIRAGAHANRILAGHRALTAVQIRGMAEQIVQKSLKYIRAGAEDKALDDMGITATVRDAVRKDLNRVAKFEGDSVVEFDITKMTDNAAAHAYMQAVHRGASQIIQEAYIGETGKWAHDDWLKLLTQFRTFGITATQKQWRRQAFTHGTAKALGFTLGAMSVALPIHLARVGLRSIGKPDREEFLDRELSPIALGRATMNYVSSVGLLPDVLDITSSAVGAPVSGGRAGNRAPFVGGQIVPAAGVVNDAWSAVQTRDPHKMVKLLPGSNLPYLQAAINQLDE